jgi:hypothetical protein
MPNNPETGKADEDKAGPQFPGGMIMVQKPGDGPDGFRKRGGDDFARRAQIQSFMLGKIIGFLDLDKDQAAKFTPLFKELGESREKIMDERRDLVKSLVSGVDNKAVSLKELNAKVIKLKKNDAILEKEREEFLKKARKFLDERQVIKLQIFEDWLKEDYFKHMKESGNPPR